MEKGDVKLFRHLCDFEKEEGKITRIIRFKKEVWIFTKDGTYKVDRPFFIKDKTKSQTTLH